MILLVDLDTSVLLLNRIISMRLYLALYAKYLGIYRGRVRASRWFSRRKSWKRRMSTPKTVRQRARTRRIRKHIKFSSSRYRPCERIPSVQFIPYLHTNRVTKIPREETSLLAFTVFTNKTSKGSQFRRSSQLSR